MRNNIAELKKKFTITMTNLKYERFKNPAL